MQLRISKVEYVLILKAEAVCFRGKNNEAFHEAHPKEAHRNKPYSKHKIYKNNNTSWRCIKKRCSGFLTLNTMEEIIKIKEHQCASNVSEIQIKEAMHELNQQVVSTMEPIPTIYKQKLNETLDRGLNLVSTDMPQFKNVKSGLYIRRNKSLGVNRLFAKSLMDVQVSNVKILFCERKKLMGVSKKVICFYFIQ